MQLMHLSLMALLACNSYIHTQSPLDPQDEKDFLFLDSEEPELPQDIAEPLLSEPIMPDEKERAMVELPAEIDDENLDKIIQELESNEQVEIVKPKPAPVDMADDEGPIIVERKKTDQQPETLREKGEEIAQEEELEFNGPQSGIVGFPEHEKIEDIVPVRSKRELIIPGEPFFVMRKADGEFILTGKYRPEVFSGKNLVFLNNCNDLDKVFYFRHTIDINGDSIYGKERYGYPAAELKFTLRNKAIWGNPASIAPTSEVSIREVDETFGAHRHGLGKHVVWIREVWVKASWNALFESEAENKHYFMLGYFPFRLGHGIALGDAYAVNPGLLGFFTENTVDQYAPGLLLTGEIFKGRLDYDIYGAIFENKSDSISNNAEPVYAQKFGCNTQPYEAGRDHPARGFGDVNWLIAARLQAVAMDHKFYGKLDLEPYILYNSAPEQKIEFPADARSKLATVGLDVDYERGGFQASCEFAVNLGHQTVHGWDRNQIISKLDSTTAAVLHVNSKVNDSATGTNALDTKSNQAAINTSLQDETQNGEGIPGTTLVNASDRFSNPFINEYHGWMFVADAGYWCFNNQVQIAIAGGIASGDENPSSNFDDPKLAPVCSTPTSPGEHDFKGFIGLQEIFNGERVESAYVLGQRKITRPLSLPNDAIENSFFADTISEFTNIAYFGTGLHVKPKWTNKFYWRPNILWYWQQKATRAFDLCSQKVSSTRFARNFLGTEFNTFVDFFPLDSLKTTFVFSWFIPGSHYADIRGEPVNKVQLQLLQDLDEDDTLIDAEVLPLLGTNNAFSFNLAFEYRF